MVVAISEYEPTDPFGNGDRYFINNFGGRTTSNGTPQQTISVVNNTNTLVTDRFLNGNFTSKYIGIQGKFTLASLKFCIDGIPSVKTNGTKNLNSSMFAINSRNIMDQCNIENPQSTTNNTVESSKALLTTAPPTNSTNPRTGNPQYAYPPYQAPKYPYPYSPSPSPQYAYPPYQAPKYPYPYAPSPQYAYPHYQAPQYRYQNLPPVANAGPNQLVNPGTFVVPMEQVAMIQMAGV